MSTTEKVSIDAMRHSCSHILAQAVMEMFPDAKLGIGPTIDDGFYYDFDLPRTLIPEDLPLLEKKMKEIVKQDQKFIKKSQDGKDAITFLVEAGQPYKAELAREFAANGEEITFFENIRPSDQKAMFVDLCEGPHVERTGQIGAFKLLKIAGAYWKGNEKNPMLQRIYGTCWHTREELDSYLKQQEEARKRDHKKLGRDLGLFTISELVGAGLPLIKPKGMIIRKTIEDFLWTLHKDKGYLRVWTPHIAKEKLYETSGHAAKFGDELFRVQGKDEKFFLKPMNCPHHMQIFCDDQFSYRDMPIRYFEPATVYRDEKSGQLGGLTRVRAITQDDGHLFCRKDQIGQEIKTIIGIIKQFYGKLGMLNDYWVRLSLRGDDKSKYLGSDEVWATAEGSLRDVCESEQLPYKEAKDEAAFYGPKLDFMFKDSIGREWQLATIQCDFNLPERFDLSFINEKGDKERPVVIHRAISGSLERFMGVLIEHFAGAFPTWLAPVQVKLLPVSEKFLEYANEIFAKLKEIGIRVELDDSNETLGKKIRGAEMMKIPYMVVIGEKEVEAKNISVRDYKTKKQESYQVEEFLTLLKKEIEI